MHFALDYTPPTTLQTLQFSSEPLNVIAMSLLASCILANIGSLTSKLLQLSPPDTFTYRGWLRSVIFAASDDPLRILSWLRRRYAYSNPSWTRSKSRLRPSRLCVPLFARITLLVASIGLIALSIPVTTYAQGCQSVDYAPIWNLSRVASMPLPSVNCIPIPLQSAVGEVLSVAEYCFALEQRPPAPAMEQGQTVLLVGKMARVGQTFTVFFNSTSAWAVGFHVQWRRLKDSDVSYASDVSNLDVDTHMSITLAAIHSVRPECLAGTILKESTSGAVVASTTMNCELSIGFEDSRDLRMDTYLRQVIAYHVTGIQWQKFARTQKRIRYTDSSNPFQDSYECPVVVALHQPVLNIVPLGILLVISVMANLLVSWATRGHGNALDAGYHIVKESLGHDTTTNPLEENEDCERVKVIEIGRWRCTTGGEGHVGFIGRQGDMPVDDFEKYTVVAQCVRAEVDLEAAKRIRLRLKSTV